MTFKTTHSNQFSTLPIKTREEIINKQAYLGRMKMMLCSTSHNFKQGLDDAAIAEELKTINARQAELGWVLNQRQIHDC